MKHLHFIALTLSLPLLTACEPDGPAAGIGDHIDEVITENHDTAYPPAVPEPEASGQQGNAYKKAAKQASREAEQRIEQILQQTQDRP